MKRSRTVYEDKTDDDDNDEVGVSAVAMSSLVFYYLKDDVVQACDQSLARSVFDGDFEWFIGWDPEGGGTDSGIRSAFFNSPIVLDAFRPLAVRARMYLRLMGGVAMWALKDLPRFFTRYINARSDAERRDLGLPFGILDAWEYGLRLRRSLGRNKAYEVVPTREDSACRYMYFDYETRLRPWDPIDMQACANRVKQSCQGDVYRDITHADTGATVGRLWMPQSPFMQLNLLREALDESHEALCDANWLSAHPQLLLRSIPPAPLRTEDTGNNDLYSTASLLEARMREPRRQRNMSFQEAVNLMGAISHSMGLNKQGAKTIRSKQRDYYRRPDMLEDVKVVDDGVELIHWDKPVVLNVYKERLEEYMNRVTVVMGIGENSRLYQAVTGKLKKEQHGVAGKSQISMMQEQRQQQMTVRQEQVIYQRLFDVFYEFAGFADRDATALSETLEMLNTVIVQRTKDVSEGAWSGSMEPAKAAVALLDLDTEEDEGGPDPVRSETKSTKVLLRRVRAWDQRLKAHPDVHLATLVFRNKDDDMNAYEYMDGMSQRGMLDTKQLENQAARVFGRRIKLHDPPEPEAPAKQKKPKTVKH